MKLAGEGSTGTSVHPCPLHGRTRISDMESPGCSACLFPGSLRDQHLEPGTFPGLSVLLDRDAGKRKDLGDEEEAKPGVLPDTPLEYILFLPGLYAVQS